MKRQKPYYLKNSGKDHQRNKLTKGNVPPPKQSYMGLKTTKLNCKKSRNIKEREPLKCWGCGELHLMRDCPYHHSSVQNIQAIYEETTVNGVAQNIPIVSTGMEDQHTDHQSTMMDIEGTILNQYVSILIGLGDSLSYISTKIMDKCELETKKSKHHGWSSQKLGPKGR